ncbi:MAG: hypothetical protein CMJ48_09135 [Planctomycetaceae bacterium]|nr:hypothetical protein [Planctomycetaceae bacterium]
MLNLEATQAGAVLPVRAQPKARKNGVTGTHDGRLRVAVTQAPEKGKANAAIVKLLAKQLKLKASQVSLVAGETSPRKKFLIEGVSLEAVRKRVEELLS